MLLLKRIIYLFLIFFLFSSLTKNLFDYRKKVQFYEEFKKEHAGERQKNRELKTAILKKSDLNEIEKTIRNKLNLLKPDEIAILLPQLTPTPILITPTPLPNYLQWFKVFF